MPRFQNTALITESFSINKVFLKVLGESLCFVRRFSIQLKGNKRTLVSSCKLCKKKQGNKTNLVSFFSQSIILLQLRHMHTLGGVWQEYEIVLLSIVSEGKTKI